MIEVYEKIRRMYWITEITLESYGKPDQKPKKTVIKWYNTNKNKIFGVDFTIVCLLCDI